MTPARYNTISVKIKADNYLFKASGSQIEFEGFMAVYKAPEETNEENSQIPNLVENEKLKLDNFNPEQHFTQPPARFTEAMLVKTLEEIGVGRPSTYVPTIGTILQRGYVVKETKNFYPTELGEIINEIMNNHFKDIVNVDFTAELESELDKVEYGLIEWKEVIRKFYGPFKQSLEKAEETIGKIEIADEVTDVICDKCGKNMVIKYGRYGKFLACPGFPECHNAKPFFENADVACPLCGGKVQIKKTKKGRKYYGCENNPECNFMSWNKPTGEKCPVCNEPLVEKGKNAKVVCSNAKCGYVKE
jgi:DNA topoisomerase-1